MSKLDELIAEFCPDGVAIKNVGDICDKITDYTAAGSFADVAKNVKYINDGVGYAQLIRTTDLKSTFKNTDKFVYVDEHAFNYLWRVNLDSECLVLPNVGNCGEIYYVTPDILPFSHNVLGPNSILVKSSIVDNRYLFYVFNSANFQKKLAKITSTTGQTKFNKTNFKALSLPVPPLEVQREIVHILDNFTELTVELTANLTAEFTARKKQYEFYRNKLLTFESDISCVPLKDVAIIERGTRVVRNQLSDSGEYPVYQNALTPMGYYEDFNRNANNTFMICAGAAGQIGFSVVDFWAADDCYTFKCNENIDNKYLFHVLKNNQYKIDSKVRKASIPRISRESVGNILVPVPELKVQKRIVNVLDNFESICTDLNIGLPAEIEARKKQYEYYRDKLLSFKELPK